MSPWLSCNSVDQAGLKLGGLPVSASGVLGLKARATTTQRQPFVLGAQPSFSVNHIGEELVVSLLLPQ